MIFRFQLIVYFLVPHCLISLLKAIRYKYVVIFEPSFTLYTMFIVKLLKVHRVCLHIIFAYFSNIDKFDLFVNVLEFVWNVFGMFLALQRMTRFFACIIVCILFIREGLPHTVHVSNDDKNSLLFFNYSFYKFSMLRILMIIFIFSISILNILKW